MSDCNNGLFNCITPLPMDASGKLSDYEFLCWVKNNLNAISESLESLKSSVQSNTDDISKLQSQVRSLSELIDKVKNGDYVDLYLDSLINYINNNLQELVGRIAYFVHFGLTDEGYFVAYIPPNWEFIRFYTDMNCKSRNYGHLILIY